MDPTRIDRLVADVRQAKERGEPYGFAEVRGRIALRIERAGGVQMSFVSTEERTAIEQALAAGPPGFELGGVHVSYDERRHMHLGRDGRVDLIFVDAARSPSEASIARWTARYAGLRASERRLCEEAAGHLDALAATWSTTPAAIRAALRLSSVTFYGDGLVVPMLDGGTPFGDHSVELEVDDDDRVIGVSLAG